MPDQTKLEDLDFNFLGNGAGKPFGLALPFSLNNPQAFGLVLFARMERVTRIELVSTDWQPVVIAIILYPLDGSRRVWREPVVLFCVAAFHSRYAREIVSSLGIDFN
jgi:hypothetical protein